jgi:hypothetical protein
MVAVAVSVVAAGPAAAAKGGNNDTAKACQHGGWKTHGPAAGGTFANQGDCVNDGAQGSAPPLGSAGQSACQQIGGSFSAVVNPLGQWTCIYMPSPTGTPPDDSNTNTLREACEQDGGGPFPNRFRGGPDWRVVCLLSGSG